MFSHHVLVVQIVLPGKTVVLHSITGASPWDTGVGVAIFPRDTGVDVSASRGVQN